MIKDLETYIFDNVYAIKKMLFSIRERHNCYDNKCIQCKFERLCLIEDLIDEFLSKLHEI